jgi:hypothetical protein
MTSYRKETNGQADQPVRFYKYVALTFLVLTIVLLGIIIFMSSKRATITVITRSNALEVNEAIMVGEEGVKGEIKTEDIELTVDFKPTEVKEEQSIASGWVTLYNKSNNNQPLVATTRLLTSEGVLFRLKDRVNVPAGGEIEVEVYADQSGIASEIGPSQFTIPGLRTDLQKLIYAVSKESMKGGIKKTGVLSIDDWSRAQQEMQEKLKVFGKEKFSTTTEGYAVVYGLTDFEMTSEAKVGDELESFKATGKAKLVLIYYDIEEVKKKLKEELNKRLIGEDELISSGDNNMTVSLGNFDLENSKAELIVYCNGLVSLSPESPQIGKEMFFGKNKDEVRRYLLSLDHVQGVEIKFSPAWMRTVPHVHDHVTVVVKNVE